MTSEVARDISTFFRMDGAVCTGPQSSAHAQTAPTALIPSATATAMPALMYQPSVVSGLENFCAA